MCYNSDEKYSEKSYEGSKNQNKEILVCYPIGWYCDGYKGCEEDNKKEKKCCCRCNHNDWDKKTR